MQYQLKYFLLLSHLCNWSDMTCSSFAQRVEELCSVCQKNLSKTAVMRLDFLKFADSCVARGWDLECENLCIPAEIVCTKHPSARARSIISGFASSTIHTVHTNQNCYHTQTPFPSRTKEPVSHSGIFNWSFCYQTRDLVVSFPSPSPFCEYAPLHFLFMLHFSCV